MFHASWTLRIFDYLMRPDSAKNDEQNNSRSRLSCGLAKTIKGVYDIMLTMFVDTADSEAE